MTPEQILDALKFLDDAWYHTPGNSSLGRLYADQIEFLLQAQKIAAKYMFDFVKNVDGQNVTTIVTEKK